jgi:N-acetylglucosamine-6-sulfatase
VAVGTVTVSDSHRAARFWLALLLAAAACALAVATGSPTRGVAVAAQPQRPNIVFILADDLSWDLIDPRVTPHIVALQKRGVTFSNYFVADSLCCPSRATIFTGLFPHDTRVLTNLGPHGGYRKFQSEHLDRKTFARAVRGRGYLTSMLGKYLNGYGEPAMTSATAPIPPGWTDWHVSNNSGYIEFNYLLNDNGRVSSYGTAPTDYGVDVLNADAQSFIQRAGRRPFLLEVATFAPHAPYTPAPRNANDFPGLKAPRDPSFDRNNSLPPRWLGFRKPLRPRQIRLIDASYRRRAQAMEAVDKLVGDVEAKLAERHLSRNTYIVFSSDNGYHLGQHRLTRGKQTAFDTDIRVPLIVAGPGVPRGRVVRQVAQNVDLYPTFAQLAGGRIRHPVDGHSLVPLLHPSKKRPRWRTLALVEHHGLNRDPSDPDFEDGRRGGNPTTYKAVRIVNRRLPGFRRPLNAVYVEYRDVLQEIEYYDIRRDPFERHNVAHRLTRRQLRELHRVLARLVHCHSARACWSAGMPN